MPKFLECPDCRHHFRSAEERCPFCKRDVSHALKAVLLAAAATVACGAKYGGPPYSSSTGSTGGTTISSSATSGSGSSGTSGSGSSGTGSTGGTGSSGTTQ